MILQRLSDNIKVNRFMNKLLAIILLYLLAAASFSGYFQKYAFREDTPGFSVGRVIEGTADRPWVHRRLLVDISHALAQSVPNQIHQKIEEKQGPLPKWYSKVQLPAGHHTEYYILYVLSFFFWFAALWMLFLLCRKIIHDDLISACGTALFALLFPLLLTNGGYYYDLAECFFFFSAIYLTSSGKW